MMRQLKNGKIADAEGQPVPLTLAPEIAQQIILLHNKGLCTDCGVKSGAVEDEVGRCLGCIEEAKKDAADEMLVALKACHDALLMLDRTHSRAYKMAEAAINRAEGRS
jgi:hypothetical protein